MESNKVIYITLVLNLRIKRDNLAALGLNSGQISDIITLLNVEFNL